jgi:hypothetical protein
LKAKNNKTVFRAYWGWNDDKEERWLSRMARAGWHLTAPRGVYYRFEKGDPADMIYRLDYQRPGKSGRQEYLNLFKDAGWEHAGEFGNWHYFRTAVGDGPVPEIHTDLESRIAKYRRLLGFSAIIMVAVWAPLMSSRGNRPSPSAFWDVFRGVQFACALLMLYMIVRLGLKIRQLRKGRTGKEAKRNRVRHSS